MLIFLAVVDITYKTLSLVIKLKHLKHYNHMFEAIAMPTEAQFGMQHSYRRH